MRSQSTELPLALSLRYRRNREKKLSISVSNSCKTGQPQLSLPYGMLRLLTFFSSGSLTVSLREVSALRICAAAMLVEVFSKACIISVSQTCHLGGYVCKEA
ncbi:hypothetical protein FJTKL_14875 [Diaporthe vaccinii]|uniref:Uncharacterized protein n=1 Tax=Diaporthe vaccinii TaxID=105482 RepID=A0ABR4F8G4_9PEZI